MNESNDSETDVGSAEAGLVIYDNVKDEQIGYLVTDKRNYDHEEQFNAPGSCLTVLYQN